MGSTTIDAIYSINRTSTAAGSLRGKTILSAGASRAARVGPRPCLEPCITASHTDLRRIKPTLVNRS